MHDNIVNASICCYLSKQGWGKERGRGKREREPVGMAKDFDSQMPVLNSCHVIFKLTTWVQAQEQQLILEKLHSYEDEQAQVFGKIRKSLNSSNI